MGWFSSSSKESAAAPKAVPEVPPPTPAKPASLTEQEQVDLLVGGGRLDDPVEAAKQSFLSSNKRHTAMDCALALSVYSFSGLQHLHGQSNAMTLLSMWAAGTTFLVNAGQREVLGRSLTGTLTLPSKAAYDAAQEEKNNLKTDEAKKGPEGSAGAAAAVASPPVAFTPAELTQMQQNVFQLEAVASWVWMLASLQQFRVQKRLKWCGYSSWNGLGCAAYFTLRHFYNVLVQ